MMLGIFSKAFWPCVYLLWRNVCSHPLPILKIGSFVSLLLSCKSSSYSLDTSPLSVMWFASISSHSGHCLFTFLMVLFSTQKFLVFNEVKLSIFPCRKVLYVRNHYLAQGQEGFLLCFLLRFYNFSSYI